MDDPAFPGNSGSDVLTGACGCLPGLATARKNRFTFAMPLN
jgi:hypothetical protein